MTTEPGDPAPALAGDSGEAAAADPGAVEGPVNGRVVARDAGDQPALSAEDVPEAAAELGMEAAGEGPDGEEAALGEAAPFRVEVPGFSGGLEQLLLLAQRGEIDLTTVPVAEITAAYRERLRSEPDPREVADFLAAASRLLALKAQRLLPDGAVDIDATQADDLAAVDDPGARLAEYRLFKAAAEALLAPVAEEGVRSFLGLVSAEVVPAERLAIPPERLAQAFRAVLERLPEVEPYTIEAVSYSVEEKSDHLRALLAEQASLSFEEVFAGVRSRLEAVATFLALLEMVRTGEIKVTQHGAFGAIRVSAVG